MVEDGETLVPPAATGVTTPTLWSMEALVAFVVVHESVDALPNRTDEGLAESVQVGASGMTTVTVAVQVTVPPVPVAVIVYVVVEDGETLVPPTATGVTMPIP